MVDIPLASSTPFFPATGTASAQTSPLSTEATIVALPEALSVLPQTMKIQATPLVLSATNDLVLQSPFGALTVTLAQGLSQADKQALLKQLGSLIDQQKPLSLTLQQGASSTQATLTLPQAPVATTPEQPRLTTASQQPPPQPSAAPLTPGLVFQAIVLPRPDQTPTEETHPVETNIPQPVKGQEINTANQPKPQPVLSFIQTSTPAQLEEALTSPLVEAAIFLGPNKAKAEALQQIIDIPDNNTNPQLVKSNLQQLPSAPPPGTNFPLPPQTKNTEITPPITSALRDPVQQHPVAKDTQASIPSPSPPENAPKQAAPTYVSAKNSLLIASELSEAPLTQKPVLSSAQSIPQQQAVPDENSLLKPGNALSLKIVSVVSSLCPPQTGALESNQMLATVASEGADGNFLLESSTASFFIKAPVSAAVGTSFIVEINKTAEPTLTPLQNPDSLPALAQVLTALEQASPHVYHNLMMNFLPQPNDALSGALLFLFGAFKQGNLRRWIGDDAVDTLASLGKSELIKKLSKEISTSDKPSQDPIVGSWRSYPIPIFADHQQQFLAIHVHNNDKEQNKSPNGKTNAKKIRFLIDMHLTKLGEMQLDGFVQPKQLDMLLRSETVLPEGLHQELRTSYIKALEAVGFTGTLNFQVGRQHWLKIQKTPEATHPEEKLI